MNIRTVRLPDHTVTKLLSVPRQLATDSQGAAFVRSQVSAAAELVAAEFDYEQGELVLRFSDPELVEPASARTNSTR